MAQIEIKTKDGLNVRTLLRRLLAIKTTGPSAFGVNIIKRTTFKINFLH